MHSKPLQIENSTPLDRIIWADDIVTLSESEEGVQGMLGNLALYARKKRNGN